MLRNRSKRVPRAYIAAAATSAVTFVKRFYPLNSRQERRRETHVAQIDFVLSDAVPNTFIRVNPLGLQIAYFRVDQAFQ